MSSLKNWLLLIAIYLLAVALRIWFVSHGTFIFGYDQARDTVYAQDILQGQLKLFSPSASGTNDTVYHGVAYYYVLAGIQAISENPVIELS